jgi:SAM-dependent methyltransferase
MSINLKNIYDLDNHIAEIYDQQETNTDDVDLIRRFIHKHGLIRILEPFCGTGRILIPLAIDGHNLLGLDQSKGMLRQAQNKISQLPTEIQTRIKFIEADVTTGEWPGGFDLVILGGNCFYELAMPEEQEACIVKAASALNTGGYIFLDNNHMEGELDESWQDLGIVKKSLSGLCTDGTKVECTMETIWYDVSKRLARFRRRAIIQYPKGQTMASASIQQKHPVSAAEVQRWLEIHGFKIEHKSGDRKGSPFTSSSSRAIFWARKMLLETNRPIEGSQPITIGMSPAKSFD